MPFVRILGGAGEEWLALQCALDRIGAKFDINKARPRISVFQSASAQEEVEAFAAFQLLKPERAGLDPQHLCRVHQEDIDSAGLTVDDSEPGVTPIRAVNARHRNLIGQRDAVARLVEILWQRHVAGEDLIRRIGKAQLDHQCRIFATLPPDAIEEGAPALLDAYLRRSR